MNKDLKDFYEEQKCKIQKEIQDLWEVGKKSESREKRLFEIDLILEGLIADSEITNLRQTIKDLKKRLESEGITFDE